MRVPRDLSGKDLVKGLGRLGYEVTRQRGSHVRLTHRVAEKTHHVTIPLHDPLRVGTLSAILREVGSHVELSRAELIRRLRG